MIAARPSETRFLQYVPAWNLPSPVTRSAEALRFVAIFMPAAAAQRWKVRGSIICSSSARFYSLCVCQSLLNGDCPCLARSARCQLIIGRGLVVMFAIFHRHQSATTTPDRHPHPFTFITSDCSPEVPFVPPKGMRIYHVPHHHRLFACVSTRPPPASSRLAAVSLACDTNEQCRCQGDNPMGVVNAKGQRQM